MKDRTLFFVVYFLKIFVLIGCCGFAVSPVRAQKLYSYTGFGVYNASQLTPANQSLIPPARPYTFKVLFTQNRVAVKPSDPYEANCYKESNGVLILPTSLPLPSPEYYPNKPANGVNGITRTKSYFPQVGMEAVLQYQLLVGTGGWLVPKSFVADLSSNQAYIMAPTAPENDSVREFTVDIWIFDRDTAPAELWEDIDNTLEHEAIHARIAKRGIAQLQIDAAHSPDFGTQIFPSTSAAASYIQNSIVVAMNKTIQRIQNTNSLFDAADKELQQDMSSKEFLRTKHQIISHAGSTYYCGDFPIYDNNFRAILQSKMQSIKENLLKNQPNIYNEDSWLPVDVTDDMGLKLTDIPILQVVLY